MVCFRNSNGFLAIVILGIIVRCLKQTFIIHQRSGEGYVLSHVSLYTAESYVTITHDALDFTLQAPFPKPLPQGNHIPSVSLFQAVPCQEAWHPWFLYLEQVPG